MDTSERADELDCDCVIHTTWRNAILAAEILDRKYLWNDVQLFDINPTRLEALRNKVCDSFRTLSLIKFGACDAQGNLRFFQVALMCGNVLVAQFFAENPDYQE